MKIYVTRAYLTKSTPEEMEAVVSPTGEVTLEMMVAGKKCTTVMKQGEDFFLTMEEAKVDFVKKCEADLVKTEADLAAANKRVAKLERHKRKVRKLAGLPETAVVVAE